LIEDCQQNGKLGSKVFDLTMCYYTEWLRYVSLRN